MQISNLGYPRIGENREWKKALESFWKQELTEQEFLNETKKLRLHALKKQQEKGLDLIPVGDFSFYDHVLDTATMFGLVPKRFNYSDGPVPLSTYFAMARGTNDAHACEMTKWFDTNYHYIVPEWEGRAPKLVENKPLAAFLEAKKELNLIGKPVVLGPFSFLILSKGYRSEDFKSILQQFVPAYIQLFKELAEAGADFVQIDEPVLVTDISLEEMDLFSDIYSEISEQVPQINFILQTYFEAVTHYEKLINLPVKGIGLDFVYGYEENINALKEYGFPKDKILGIGLIDGRNIWKSNLEELHTRLQKITEVVPQERQIVQPSSSLLHVPITLKPEDQLPDLVKQSLAFGDEKLDELLLLKQYLTGSNEEVKEAFTSHQNALEQVNKSNWRRKKGREQLPSKRQTPFATRYELQQKKWNLPLLPTTTIGSFPQTKEVRQKRFAWRKGNLSHDAYINHIETTIEKWIRIQEDLGLDVLVHGEFERNDMVEFFGEKLGGFAFSKNGWVQSYGSRCVKPPIIYGNVEYIGPMTIAETTYAQSLTNKPVKGMLTGPVTILNWSFARNDLENEEIAFQIAESLLKEVKLLENEGITMIQVDEPALREGLPLKKEKQTHYLSWAVEAFRTATSDVSDTTQIHTHMCYSNFELIIDSIIAMDADVISIETSRSHAELITSFESTVYDKGIGLGVYDIHSPRVPSEEEMIKVIDRALNALPATLFWVNPDCGLKTRSEQETISALTNMVRAAKTVRERVANHQLQS
ncbi:5-methyltetrahydropteroyltriglutamate--homocysteine S-methyltransferase [bacterium LRH843]|nr:5-methyltetrahydropteroyltriglutamate--homocysteine S-methyltransferase [bacterium LRH843]